MYHKIIQIVLLCALILLPGLSEAEKESGVGDTELLNLMQFELDRSFKNLKNADETPIYYMQYAVIENRDFALAVTNGGLEAPISSTLRYLDVDIRVGSPELDNTHEIRSDNWRDNYTPRRLVQFPLEADPLAVRTTLWNETEYKRRKALDRFTKVKANRQLKVEEEDTSADFSAAQAQQFEEIMPEQLFDAEYWRPVLKRVGQYGAGLPFVKNSSVRLQLTQKTTYMVNTEGTRLQHGACYIRLFVNFTGMAEDGMELRRTEGWNAASFGKLPSEEEIMATSRRLGAELKDLIDAPVVTPFVGPAILVNRASGVFFHEIFGHRLEGHRQKSESEGQTFTKMVGKSVLPDFLDVLDDATLADFDGIDLRGYYKFDDEGVPAQPVSIVENGVLKEFLLTRSPIDGFPRSNGHARRDFGREVVARMGNTIVRSSKAFEYQKLREMLIDEIKKQEKPYGLIFQDISGGFTMTGRGGTQAFKVIPLLVYRVFPDGREDEVVRGVDIVGTPLTSFSKIIATGDDPAVFNGTCGAESGSVPVSAISPSILVSEIEVERVRKGQEKPPLLPPPNKKGQGGAA
ncbi:MAG: hypothetical protein K8R59_12410 [Thermoanaerobaculales bacterium]|nr:hypothetical protein [Thermoanaerobaculales bacterium]